MHPNPRFAESHGISTDGTAWLDWWKEQATLSIRFDWSPYVEDLKALANIAPDFPGFVAEDREVLAPDVRDILRWLAAGQSEVEILRHHPELTAADIREILARAADRLKEPLHPWSRSQSPSTLASRWAGKFTLPDDDPSDARLTYLLERYRRHRE